MAPNLITLLGFLSVVLPCGVLLYYCPGVYHCAAPRWAYALAALGIYLYQIFDNVDGRQARRTGSSSPLGELFDHGCDSLFVPVAGMLIFNGMYYGAWGTWLAFWSTGVPFFMAHWEEFHTGELVLGVLGNPTEGQIVMILNLLVSAVYGPQLWGRDMNDLLGANLLPNISLSEFMLALVLVSGQLMTVYNTIAVLRDVAAKKRNVVRSLLLLFPMSIAGFATTAWFWVSPAKLLETRTASCIFFMGLQFSYILARLMIARITITEYNVWNPVFLLPVVGLLNAVYNKTVMLDIYLFYGVYVLMALCTSIL